MAYVWEVSNDEYHADKSKVGSTMLKKAIRSPAEYRRRYVDNDPLVDAKSEALSLGSAFHCHVLEPDKFDSLFACRPDGIDGRTKEGKVKLAEFNLSALGKTILTAEMRDQSQSMAKAVLAEPFMHEIMSDAILERAVVWDEDGVACKVKSDIFVPRPSQSSDLVLDLKSADDPTPECFGAGGGFSPIRKYRYDMQLYHYSRGIAALTDRPCSAGLVVVGKSDPWDVFIYDITPWLEVGFQYWNAAMNTVRLGVATGEWRRPEQGNIVTLTPSKWDFME